MKLVPALLGLSLALTLIPARAEINIGITLSATGPAASLGIPEKNSVALMPATLAGEKVNYIVLDDASDPSAASKNARKLITENKADVIIGSSTVPTSLAVVEVANEFKTPQIAIAPITPAEEKRTWAFSVPQSNAIMVAAVVDHMRATGIQTVGFIGYNDPFGEGWWREFAPLAEKAGIKIVASERYNRTDTSVIGQTLKILGAKPDAVLVVGSGTPAVLPQSSLVEKGYKGRFYQSHGAANRDFLRVGGKAVEGAVIPVGPMLVAEQLPDGHSAKKVAGDYLKAYEGAHGPDSRSTFGGHTWDAMLLLQRALPEALKKAKPGTPEFRAALRDALEAVKELPATHGVFSMGAKDHNGLDARARVLVRVENGAWKLIK